MTPPGGREARFNLINQRPAAAPPRAGNLRPFQQSGYHLMAADPSAHFSDPVRWPVMGSGPRGSGPRGARSGPPPQPEMPDPEHGDSF